MFKKAVGLLIDWLWGSNIRPDHVRLEVHFAEERHYNVACARLHGEHPEMHSAEFEIYGLPVRFVRPPDPRAPAIPPLRRSNYNAWVESLPKEKSHAAR